MFITASLCSDTGAKRGQDTRKQLLLLRKTIHRHTTIITGALPLTDLLLKYIKSSEK